MSSLPNLISLNKRSDPNRRIYPLHKHSFYEFTLVTDSHAQINYMPGNFMALPNTLILYHIGEVHGAVVRERQNPAFWVVHFSVDYNFLESLPVLANQDPKQRVWKLRKDQVDSFKWVFFHMMNERNSRQPHHEASTSAWLQLMLVNVQRWSEKATIPEISSTSKANPDVQKLWPSIIDSVNQPAEFGSNIFDIPNYDSIRHAFRKCFGCSPREMLIRLRMEQARSLLLETNLSIKEISDRSGYSRQNEFYRAFLKHCGCSPSDWRENPIGKM